MARVTIVRPNVPEYVTDLERRREILVQFVREAGHCLQEVSQIETLPLGEAAAHTEMLIFIGAVHYRSQREHLTRFPNAAVCVLSSGQPAVADQWSGVTWVVLPDASKPAALLAAKIEAFVASLPR